MKIPMLLLTVALLLGGWQCNANTNPAPTTTEADASSDESAVRSLFLRRLRELATRGNLFEPDSVAQILDMKLHASNAPGERPPLPCGDGTMKTGEVIAVAPSGPTWFRTLPTGAGHIEVPAFMINPATTTGDPEFKYVMYHSVYCADWLRMRDHKQASVSFNGLPAFSCLTPANIAKEIPEIRTIIATDGVFILRLKGRVNDDSASSLEFVFRAGAACALGADIKQDQEDGLRYLRALSKYDACRTLSDREFCSKHPDVTWRDRELMRDMVMQRYERCGTVNTFLAKEPVNGEPAPPIKERRSLCEGL